MNTKFEQAKLDGAYRDILYLLNAGDNQAIADLLSEIVVRLDISVSQPTN